DHSKASAIAFLPFEIVEQRPNEIAAQLNASRKGILLGSKMSAQIGYTVDVSFSAVSSHQIIEARSVLSHVYLGVAIMIAQANQPLSQTGGIDRPVPPGGGLFGGPC